MLTGKTAIITGANRGIGLATVEVFAEQKAVIWACAHTQSDEFEDKIAEIANRNSTIIYPVYFDVKDKTAVKNAVKTIGKSAKSMDILVNNAGVSVKAFLNMMSYEMMREALEVNFFSQVYLTQCVSRYMIKAKTGSIINVASVSGIVNSQGDIAYGSSKAASIFSTKTMALELGSDGIRVNSVSPGFIDTDMWKTRKREVYDKVLSETPLGRQGKPREVANVILFLASNMSSYITGQNIVVDGGRMSGGGRRIIV